MLKQLWLAVRSLAMTVLFPGTVTAYIPYRMLRPLHIPTPNSWFLQQYGALLVLSFGLAILFKCIWEFAHFGRGTLAPFDEPRKLVVRGLYRYVRNPMYVGVLLVLLAESWFFWSSRLLAYTGFCFIIANVFIMGYEEHRLRFKFGKEYERYCHHVRRWIPGRPYQESG
jgi:protein-S-isoprenylcysteine O-methyltransferase Ste14